MGNISAYGEGSPNLRRLQRRALGQKASGVSRSLSRSLPPPFSSPLLPSLPPSLLLCLWPHTVCLFISFVSVLISFLPCYLYWHDEIDEALEAQTRDHKNAVPFVLKANSNVRNVGTAVHRWLQHRSHATTTNMIVVYKSLQHRLHDATITNIT